MFDVFLEYNMGGVFSLVVMEIIFGVTLFCLDVVDIFIVFLTFYYL